MNENSRICVFIKDNPDDWREKLDEKKIGIKEKDGLVIFNYDIAADFSDPVVQEARGIIIDLSTLDVVCWPFRKFGNYQESYADKIDWDTARVQDKIDGSIVKLWYLDGWRWSTNSMIDASDAVSSITSTDYLKLIKDTANYNMIPFDELDQDYTYIFELTGPLNQIVVHYDIPLLYHIGTRNNRTGKEIDIDIGIRKPAEYSIRTMEECIDAAAKLNDTGAVQKEGFVVVDKDYHRIKVKSPKYLEFHHMSMNRSYTKNRILDMILNNEPEKIEEMIKAFPDSEVYIRFYQWKLAEMKSDIRQMIAHSRMLYEEYSHDRKAVAAEIKRSPYAHFGFKAIGNEKNADDLIMMMSTEQIGRFIEDYKPKGGE